MEMLYLSLEFFKVHKKKKKKKKVHENKEMPLFFIQFFVPHVVKDLDPKAENI